MTDTVDKAAAWDAISEKNADIARLRKGIQAYLDGDYHPNPRDAREKGPQETCFHGAHYWETCENCIDEYFTKLLAQTSSIDT